MTSLVYSFIVIILYSSTIVSIINIEGAAGAAQKAIFVFGDSLFDAGNNQFYTPTVYIRANHHPYGSTFFGTATGRYSDGMLVPDFIAQYANMPLIPPALDYNANGTYGYNFASAESGVLYYDNVMNLFDQLALFKNLTAKMEQEIGEEYKIVLQQSVYLFSTGGNDYLDFSQKNQSATEQEIQDFVDVVIQGIKEGIQEIYMKGGRKFAFQDVGPLGCMPIMKYKTGQEDGCCESINYIVKLHNIALRETFQNLTQKYEDIKYGVFDYYNQLYYRMSNATNYGFKDSEIACCGYGGKINAENCGTSPYFLCSNPSAFVFFDGAHTSQATNSQLAKLMWIGDQDMIAPYNVKQLFENFDQEAEEFNDTI